ncbi:MAG TPA: class I SAM-dependent methyltransferase [Actinomycetes bacterium]
MTKIPPLGLTGERTLPGIWHENYWFRRHEVVYRWLRRLVTAGDRVLDAGCGEGYGAHLLAWSGAFVVGVDYDEATTRHVRAQHPGVAVVRGNLVTLPLADGTLDAVVSLQTIEHLWDQPRFVDECVRVLRPSGLLALSTPNRLTFSPGVARGEQPLNPFHARELDAGELADLVRDRADVDGVYGVAHGPRLEAWERRNGSLVRAQLARPYDLWPQDLATLVRGIDADDFVVSAADVDSSLDLVVLGRAR